jgi:hypothetical protein
MSNRLENSATLLQGSDFNLHAYLSPVRSPANGYSLTITSQRQAVRNPGEEHVRFFTCLEREGLQALAELIQQTLQCQQTETFQHE